MIGKPHRGHKEGRVGWAGLCRCRASHQQCAHYDQESNARGASAFTLPRLLARARLSVQLVLIGPVDTAATKAANIVLPSRTESPEVTDWRIVARRNDAESERCWPRGERAKVLVLAACGEHAGRSSASLAANAPT